jgi:hypothetical protein
MPTETVYGAAGANDFGYIDSTSTSYTKAASGTESVQGFQTTALYVGQEKVSIYYHVYQSFIKFIPAGLNEVTTVDEATLYLYAVSPTSHTSSVFDVQVSALKYDSFEVSDYQAVLTRLDVIASIVSSSLATGYSAFTSDGLEAAISNTDYTGLVLYSENQRNKTAPTEEEYINFTSASYSGTGRDPKLIITYTVPYIVNINSLYYYRLRAS